MKSPGVVFISVKMTEKEKSIWILGWIKGAENLKLARICMIGGKELQNCKNEARKIEELIEEESGRRATWEEGG